MTMDPIILKSWAEIHKYTPYYPRPIPPWVRQDLKYQGIVKRALKDISPHRSVYVWAYVDDIKYYFYDRERHKK